MKKYFKIFLTTLSIQLAGFIGLEIIDSVFKRGIPAVGWLCICLVVSTLVGLIAPLITFRKISSKILAILLLPTNYTIIIIVFILRSVVINILKGIENLPPNFG